MSSDILRQTIYNPLRHIARRVIGDHRWEFLPAGFVTFLISGLMHELIYYHLTHLHPTLESTVFFVMQGILVDVEIVMEKKMMKGRNWQFVNMISRPMVLGFRVVTSFWLMPFFRDDMYEKASSEYSLVVDFVKELLPFSI
ncbi:hypothetical protein SLE2022_204170 [Rubroshorea leprosula]